MIGHLSGTLWRKWHIWGVTVFVMLTACTVQRPELSDIVDKSTAGWRIETVETGGPALAMVVRDTGTGPLSIYIEGDGHAYLSRGTPGTDPTPLNPVALQLALKQGGNVVYMGRPCQWARGASCADNRIWTTQRFTEDVARRYTALVGQQAHGRPVVLVGYSGGAWVALQVAARLANVVRVVTVAGNMVPNYVNLSQHVSTIDVAPYPGNRLATLPVDAYVGVNDTLIGPDVVSAYRRKVGAEYVRVMQVDASHAQGWYKLNIQ